MTTTIVLNKKLLCPNRGMSDRKSPCKSVTETLGQPRAVHDSFGHPSLTTSGILCDRRVILLHEMHEIYIY